MAIGNPRIYGNVQTDNPLQITNWHEATWAKNSTLQSPKKSPTTYNLKRDNFTQINPATWQADTKPRKTQTFWRERRPVLRSFTCWLLILLFNSEYCQDFWGPIYKYHGESWIPFGYPNKYILKTNLIIFQIHIQLS